MRAFLKDPDFFNSPNSKALDQRLGLEVVNIEKDLLEEARRHRPHGHMGNWGPDFHQGHQTWVGLDPQVLQTPYQELLKMCELLVLQPGEHVIDLGAGYGRLAWILKQKYPEVSFTGYEYVKERVDEGNRVLQEELLIQQDLSDPDFELPVADSYFIYDFGKVQHIRKILQQLEDMAETNSFKVVARGRGTRSMIQHEHPWLAQINPPHHEENWSLYSMG